jgi:pimeloyl-ACP methyl ester carboxylesterase
VLVLAGSSGRIDVQRARVISELGCITESIRWFGGSGQHAAPWEIPLETFLARLDVLKQDCDRVFVVGTSYGAEAALLCGAYSDQVDGVIAFAPTDVVWAGHDDSGTETSHWTLDGRALRYVPLDWSAHVSETPPRYRPLYERSRETFADRVPEATIPVERIRSLLLVAGGADQVWPSLPHAERISARRAARGLASTIVSEDGAGHRTVLPGEEVVSSGIRMQRGGTEAADRELGSRAWDAIAAMLTPLG